jgi:hypothetical protein
MWNLVRVSLGDFWKVAIIRADRPHPGRGYFSAAKRPPPRVHAEIAFKTGGKSTPPEQAIYAVAL